MMFKYGLILCIQEFIFLYKPNTARVERTHPFASADVEIQMTFISLISFS